MLYIINVFDIISIAILIIICVIIFFKIRSEKKVEAEKITLLKKCDKCEIILNNGETYLFDKNTNNINFKTKMIKIDKNLIMFDMIDKINLL